MNEIQEKKKRGRPKKVETAAGASLIQHPEMGAQNLIVYGFQMSPELGSERALEIFLANKPAAMKVHGYRYVQHTGCMFVMAEEFQG